MNGRYRRNSKPCVLCREETRDWDYVCQKCRKAVKFGWAALENKAGEERKPDDLMRMPVKAYWDLYQFSSDPAALGRMSRDIDYRNKLSNKMLELMGANEIKGIQWGAPSEEVKALGSAFNDDSRNKCNTYFVERWKYLLALEIVEMIQNLIAYRYREGKRRGTHFIKRLANGEISMSDLQ